MTDKKEDQRPPVKKTLVLDIEANAIENPDKLWCVVTKDTETGDVTVFRKPKEGDEGGLCRHLSSYDCVVGHNILGYDWRVLSSFLRRLPEVTLLDTLILSRLLHFNIEGGHSLEAWGERLGFKKQEFDKFDEFSEEMVEYCVNDVELTHKLYDFLMEKYGNKSGFQSAIEVEHKFQIICDQIKERGFHFNYEKAKEIHEEISSTLRALEKELRTNFPPKTKLLREGVVKETRHGTVSKVGLSWWTKNSSDLSSFSPGAAYSLFEYVPFNPASPSQIVERLNELGWNPVEKTKGHIQAERGRDKEKLEKFRKSGYKVSEKNLATLPEDAPEAAQKLVEYILLTARVRTLQTWFDNYNPLSGAIHGTVISIGTWPHRVAHRNPNMGNIPTEKSIKYNEGRHRELALKYGKAMRSLWRARPGHWQVGCDAASAHLRILAHLANDEKMIEAALGDTHTANKEALGDVCRDRDQAKTFIYSFINGAGAGKVAEILNCRLEEARRALRNFDEYYPGFAAFKERQLPIDEERGYILALDGRPIVFKEPRFIIPAYLLSGEACIMKHANVHWHSRLTREKIPFHQLAFNHDEWQTEVLDNESKQVAQYVGKVQEDSIKWAGELFEMNCPMDGESKIGRTWYDAH